MKSEYLSKFSNKIYAYSMKHENNIVEIFSKLLTHKQVQTNPLSIYKNFIIFLQQLINLESLIEDNDSVVMEDIRLHLNFYRKVFLYALNRLELTSEGKYSGKVLYVYLSNVRKIIQEFNIKDSINETEEELTQHDINNIKFTNSKLYDDTATPKKMDSVKQTYTGIENIQPAKKNPDKTSSILKKRTAMSETSKITNSESVKGMTFTPKENIFYNTEQDNTEKITTLAKYILHTLDCLRILLFMLNRDLLGLMNQYGLVGANKIITQIDIDHINKLIELFYSQSLTILKRQCGSLSGTNDVFIKLRELLNDNMNNFPTNIVLDKKRINALHVVDLMIGNAEVVVEYINNNQKYTQIIDTLKKNLSNITTALDVIRSNSNSVGSFIDSTKISKKSNTISFTKKVLIEHEENPKDKSNDKTQQNNMPTINSNNTQSQQLPYIVPPIYIQYPAYPQQNMNYDMSKLYNSLGTERHIMHHSKSDADFNNYDRTCKSKQMRKSSSSSCRSPNSSHFESPSSDSITSKSSTSSVKKTHQRSKSYQPTLTPDEYSSTFKDKLLRLLLYYVFPELKDDNADNDDNDEPDIDSHTETNVLAKYAKKINSKSESNNETVNNFTECE